MAKIVQGNVFNGAPVVGLQADIPLSRRVQLAVLAHIRHTHTRYDLLLRETSWENARKVVEPICLDFIIKWRGDEETGRDQISEILREIVVISDSEDSSDDSLDDDDDDDDDNDDSSDDGEVSSTGSDLIDLHDSIPVKQVMRAHHHAEQPPRTESGQHWVSKYCIISIFEDHLRRYLCYVINHGVLLMCFCSFSSCKLLGHSLTSSNQRLECHILRAKIITSLGDM